MNENDRHQGRHEVLIRKYFLSCSYGSAAEIADFFSTDATIYDTNHQPISSREQIGQFWIDTREQWNGATWHVDSVIESDQLAAIEWTMKGTLDGDEVIFHGSEHYTIVGAVIHEIRQYWSWRRNALTSGLLGYDYPDA